MGRLFGRSVRVVSGGNSAASAGCTTWKMRSGCSRSLSRCSPRSSSDTSGGRSRSAELRGAGRDEHLAAVTGRADPRGAMHLDPHVGPCADPPLARVQPHAHADPRVVGPRMPLERELRLDRGTEGRGCGREDGEERVALRADDQAVVRLDRRPHDVVMLLEQRRVRVAEVLDEPRAPLDVGEQERDGSRRQVAESGHAPS